MEISVKRADLAHVMQLVKLTKRARKTNLTEKVEFLVTNGSARASVSDSHRIHTIQFPVFDNGANLEVKFYLPLLKIPKTGSEFIGLEFTQDLNKVILHLESESKIFPIEEELFLNVPDFVNFQDSPVFEIWVDPHFLKDAAHAFTGSGRVLMRFYGDNRPFTIADDDPKNKKNALTVLLPMRKI